MADRLAFSRPRGDGRRPAWNAVAVFLVVVALSLSLTRSWWSPAAPDGVLVEVVGEVERPGVRLVDPPTVHGALTAVGASTEGIPDRALKEGDRVELFGGRVRVLPPSDPVLVGLPVDLNAANVETLVALPGLTRSRATAIVSERDRAGAFTDLADLRRVPGFGPSAIEELRPFVVVTRPPPIDLTRAGAAELERLPGIGPVLAARLIVDREESGPCRALSDLLRVRGVDRALVDGLEGLATCSP